MSDLADKVLAANHYTDIFSSAPEISSEYRRLAKELHPDGFTGVGKDKASKAFMRLSQLKSEATMMHREGRWGERRVLATLTTRKAKHEVTKLYVTGDLASLYKATTVLNNGAEATLVKVAKSPADNDLLAQEARALKKLTSVSTDTGERHVLTRHFPQLYDTFLHNEGRRRTNVIEDLAGYYSLEQVTPWWDTGIPGPHLAWIWRRMLMALGFAHDQGLLHGAVLPQHVMIHPSTHGVLLVDWCYSVVIDSESKTNIKAVVPGYNNHYPQEVLNKEQPSAATDLYMAANTMLWSSSDIPKAMVAFFKGTMLTRQSTRPQNAWLLLQEFDELLKDLGGPYYPRRYVEMIVPTGHA